MGRASHRGGASRILGLTALVAASLLVPAASAAAAGRPDLGIVRSGPATAAVGAPFVERLRITNLGTAPAAGVTVLYAPGTPIVAGKGAGVACGAIMKGHSGRGGGYRRVGWSCSKTIAGGLRPGRSTTVSIAVTSAAAIGLAESSGRRVPR